MKELFIKTEFIELKNALKILDFISTGGEAKFFLETNECFINDEKETRRGRKLYENDVLKIGNNSYIVKNEH